MQNIHQTYSLLYRILQLTNETICFHWYERHA